MVMEISVGRVHEHLVFKVVQQKHDGPWCLVGLKIPMLVSQQHILRNEGSGVVLLMNAFPKLCFISVLEDNAIEE